MTKVMITAIGDLAAELGFEVAGQGNTVTVRKGDLHYTGSAQDVYSYLCGYQAGYKDAK